MLQLDFVLGPFIINANRVFKVEDLGLEINGFEFIPEQEKFKFYITDAVDGNETTMDVSIEHLSYWLNAKTPKAQKYIMDCIIKDVLFDYSDITYSVAYDEIDDIAYLYGDDE